MCFGWGEYGTVLLKLLFLYKQDVPCKMHDKDDYCASVQSTSCVFTETVTYRFIENLMNFKTYL